MPNPHMPFRYVKAYTVREQQMFVDQLGNEQAVRIDKVETSGDQITFHHSRDRQTTCKGTSYVKVVPIEGISYL